MEPITFRAGRVWPALYFAIFQTIPALTLVAACFDDLDATPLTLFFVGVLSLLGVYCGVGLWRLRIVADSVGLRRSPRWFGGYRVRWVDVTRWSVRPLDSTENLGMVLDLEVRGRLWSVRILEGEVDRPGFDVLVECVRARVGAAEASSPAVPPP